MSSFETLPEDVQADAELRVGIYNEWFQDFGRLGREIVKPDNQRHYFEHFRSLQDSLGIVYGIAPNVGFLNSAPYEYPDDMPYHFFPMTTFDKTLPGHDDIDWVAVVMALYKPTILLNTASPYCPKDAYGRAIIIDHEYQHLQDITDPAIKELEQTAPGTLEFRAYQCGHRLVKLLENNRMDEWFEDQAAKFDHKPIRLDQFDDYPDGTLIKKYTGKPNRVMWNFLLFSTAMVYLERDFAPEDRQRLGTRFCAKHFVPEISLAVETTSQ